MSKRLYELYDLFGAESRTTDFEGFLVDHIAELQAKLERVKALPHEWLALRGIRTNDDKSLDNAVDSTIRDCANELLEVLEDELAH